jgi:hypothetical protein
MNDGRVIPKLGLVVDAHATLTALDVEAGLDAGVAYIRVRRIVTTPWDI